MIFVVYAITFYRKAFLTFALSAPLRESTSIRILLSMSSLTLVQLNIERDKHLDRIFPFLQSINPDVVCVQEVTDHTIPRFEHELGYHSFFVPMYRRVENGVAFKQGVAVFSKVPFSKTWSQQYGGFVGPLPEYVQTDPVTMHRMHKYELAFAEIEKGRTLFRVATTHFPWTAEGSATDFQRQDMHTLLQILSHTGAVVLTGDFNAPRGEEIFTMLAEQYTDNIPVDILSSIDGTLHKAGPLPYMVDGIFSSPHYLASNVTMHTNVSDHCAFVATIDARD